MNRLPFRHEPGSNWPSTWIAEVEAEQAAGLDTEEDQAARLIRLSGIGLVSATMLADEIFFRDFRNRREVAGYLGLASSPWARGRVRRDQGISKSGNPRARRTAIELAWLWLRHQPGSLQVRWFRQRVGTARAGCNGSYSWRWPAN